MVGIKRKNPFILPERSNPESIEAEYDNKRFKQWISDLPIGNISKTAHALYSELDRLNRLEIAPSERFEALELLLPSMSFVLEKLQLFFATKPIPFSKEIRLVARLHLELLVSVIVGYKTVLAQFHDGSFTGYLLHKHTRSNASRRVLYFLGEVLLHEYTAYRSSPKYVWKEIHGIYYYAVQNDLQHEDGEVADSDQLDRLSLKDIYKRILLLALVDPNSLLRGEVKKVNDALVRWLPHVVLVPINKEVPSSPVFLIDSQKDASPCPADVCDKAQIKIGWLLVTANLDEVLEREINAMKEAVSSQLRPMDAVSIKLISKLRDVWSRTMVSRDDRKKKTEVIEVACGIMSLHELFGGKNILQSATGKQNSAFFTVDAKGLDQKSAVIEHDEYIIDAGGELSLGFSSDSEQTNKDEAEPDVANFLSVHEFDSVECVSVDNSKNGYYLTWPEESEYKAHVGELIGLNSRENLDLGEAWTLGIIRWARIRDNGLMGFGIELLDGDIKPIRIERWYNNNSKADVLLGFQQIVNGQTESVLTNPFYIGEKDRLILVNNAEQVPIVPDRILECTDSIMRFKIKTASNEIGVAESEAKQLSASNDPFNIIWDDLEI